MRGLAGRLLRRLARAPDPPARPATPPPHRPPPGPHSCCFHRTQYLLVFGDTEGWLNVCCHCGGQQVTRRDPQDDAGHGPFHPKPFRVAMPPGAQGAP